MKMGDLILRIYGWTWWLRLFCWAICKLDRLPRYGRTYRLLPERKIGPAEWRYQKYGHWGMNILDNLGLFWPYLDYLHPGWDECEPPKR